MNSRRVVLAMLQQVRAFLEMIRFSHTVFALPFAMLSALLAWQDERESRHWPLDLAGIVLCMVFARSTAMAFNRLADHHIDAANPRTAGRHLPAGRLSRWAVWIFTVVCAAGFIASTAIFLAVQNPWPLFLSVPVLAFICAYSLAKRFTALAHFWLGTSLMLAPLAAWIAIRGLRLTLTPILLGLVVFFWVAGFDMIYACLDVDFDRRTKLHSVGAALGVRGALRAALACHLLMIALLFALYWAAAPLGGPIYLIGIGAIAALILYEHWLVRPDDLSRVNLAFFHVNAVISVGLLAIVALQLVLRI